MCVPNTERERPDLPWGGCSGASILGTTTPGVSSETALPLRPQYPGSRIPKVQDPRASFQTEPGVPGNLPGQAAEGSCSRGPLDAPRPRRRGQRAGGGPAGRGGVLRRAPLQPRLLERLKKPRIERKSEGTWSPLVSPGLPGGSGSCVRLHKGARRKSRRYRARRSRRGCSREWRAQPRGAGTSEWGGGFSRDPSACILVGTCCRVSSSPKLQVWGPLDKVQS